METSVFFQGIDELRALNIGHPVWARAIDALGLAQKNPCSYARSMGDSLTYWTHTLDGINHEYQDLGEGRFRRHCRYRTLLMPLSDDIHLEIVPVNQAEERVSYRDTEDVSLYEGNPMAYLLGRERIVCLTSDVAWRLSGQVDAQVCIVRVTCEAPQPRSTHALHELEEKRGNR